MNVTSRESTWRPGYALDVLATLSPMRRGPYDPTVAAVDGAIWFGVRHDSRPVTVCITSRPADGSVDVRTWGAADDADELLAAVPSWLGADDDVSDFRPLDPLVERAWRRLPGLRIGRTGRVVDAVVPAVLEQKVTSNEAHRSWRALVRRAGAPAPGPCPPGLLVPPSAADLRVLPSWEWHRAGVEQRRAGVIGRAAAVAARLDTFSALPSSEADVRLRSLPGIGPWTSAEVRQRSHGDADAVSVGDSGLPHHIAYAYAGERRADDDRMLELLEPYRGHRHRVSQLIARTAPPPPRQAPRAPIRDFTRF